LIPLAIPNICGNEAAYLQECVDTNFVSSVGPFVERLEDLVAAASGSANAVATSSGTSGLHAALVAIGVKRDDLVIMPAMTFIATANAISHCGASPWLFDIDEESWTLDAKQLSQALDTECIRRGDALIHRGTGRRVAAVMPVFTLGCPPDMDAIVEAAHSHGLPVVADTAAALGATYKGAPVAACGADLSVFSFNGNKTVTAGGGGIVAGDDKELLNLVRHLTTTARANADYDHDRVGFNYRMTNLQAAVGCAQMEMLIDFVASKRKIHATYGNAFHTLRDTSPFPEPEWGHSACWFTGLILDHALAKNMPEIRSQLVQSEIDARPFWKPMNLQQPYADVPCEALDVTENIWRRILTLPCSTGITDMEQQAVINAVIFAIQESRQ
jgi:perosamine synthetase